MMLKYRIIFFVFVSFLRFYVGAKLPNLGDDCQVKTGLQGVCTLIDDCPVPTVFSLYTTNACTSHNTNVVVCCAGATLKVFKSESLAKCQKYSESLDCSMGALSGTDLVENRFESIKDFPHIGIIWYRKYIDDGGRATQHHLGSLISSRFVLCAAASLDDTDRIPTAVEFGSIDQAQGVHGETIEYDIEKTIVHPDYDAPSIHNDIGLIKLLKQVQFSQYVRPICLPDANYQPKIVYRVNYYQIGYTFNPLVKYQRRNVANNVCNATYSVTTLIPNGYDDNFMCTTSQELGDSTYFVRFDGAPISFDHPTVACARVLLGISAAVLKTRIADAAIKVYKYREWIENIIWAEREDI